MTGQHRVVLINPNTDLEATAAMLKVGRQHTSQQMTLDALTASVGPKMIIDEAGLAVARAEVGEMAGNLSAYQGVIVAAFGNPGMERLRSRLSIPVVGIGEAAMLAASVRNRRFAVVTSTPGLVPPIVGMAASLDLSGRFDGVFLTRGEPLVLRENPEALAEELFEAAIAAIKAGTEAIIVGGGPFVAAALALDDALPIEIIQPVPAAVAEMRRRLGPHFT